MARARFFNSLDSMLKNLALDEHGKKDEQAQQKRDDRFAFKTDAPSRSRIVCSLADMVHQGPPVGDKMPDGDNEEKRSERAVNVSPHSFIKAEKSPSCLARYSSGR
jgi:hypothetical protein